MKRLPVPAVTLHLQVFLQTNTKPSGSAFKIINTLLGDTVMKYLVT